MSKFEIFVLSSRLILVTAIGILFYKASHNTAAPKVEDTKKQTKNTKTHKVTVKKPDGTTTTTTDTTTTDKTNETTKTNSPKWILSGGIGTSVTLLPSYSVQLQYRLIGPVLVGGQIITGPNILGLVTAGVEF